MKNIGSKVDFNELNEQERKNILKNYYTFIEKYIEAERYTGLKKVTPIEKLKEKYAHFSL